MTVSLEEIGALEFFFCEVAPIYIYIAILE